MNNIERRTEFNPCRVDHPLAAAQSGKLGTKEASAIQYPLELVIRLKQGYRKNPLSTTGLASRVITSFSFLPSTPYMRKSNQQSQFTSRSLGRKMPEKCSFGLCSLCKCSERKNVCSILIYHRLGHSSNLPNLPHTPENIIFPTVSKCIQCSTKTIFPMPTWIKNYTHSYQHSKYNS